MYYKRPLLKTEIDGIYALAPIPIYYAEFHDHDLHDEVFNLGFNELTPEQKLMGQELPEQYDAERQAHYDVNYYRWDQWTEPTEFNPIGSRFSVPTNDFLNRPEECVKEIKRRCENAYKYLLDGIEQPHNNNSLITESWMQFYNPTEGRGHNQHNHCRWQPDEETVINYVGGYYLSDGEPILDHPYSGVLTFHLRGMSHFIRPKKGMLLLWPYDIVHSVKPFYGKSHRCVINFNIQDGGKIVINEPSTENVAPVEKKLL